MGTDPSGGAGRQADLKAFTALGASGMSVVTLATDCITQGVEDRHLVPSGFVIRPLEGVVQDIPAAATKTDMLFDAEVMKAVTEAIRHAGTAIVSSPRVSTLVPRASTHDSHASDR